MFYSAYYLVIVGTGLLLISHRTLEILQSSVDYGDVFPRVSGMLMSDLGLAVLRMIRAHAHELYPATTTIHSYFIVCIVAFYIMTHDPLFLVLLGIVAFGLFVTFGAYLFDQRSNRA